MGNRPQLPCLRGEGSIMLTYPVGDSGETISFSDLVLEKLKANRQTKWWHSESCGLLFARTAGKLIQIEAATGPYRSGWRTRYACTVPPMDAQREINEMHPMGLHYVGEWHSHPEPVPRPSGRDRKTMSSRVLKSEHDLQGFIFVLIGQAPLPEGISVLVHDGCQEFELEASQKTISAGAKACLTSSAKDSPCTPHSH